MSRTMFDALDARKIPHGVAIGAWYPHDPRSHGAPVGAKLVLGIDNRGNCPDCQILDVEAGAAPFGAVLKWLEENHNPYPTIYCSQANLAAVVKAVGSKPFHLWVAHWGTGPTEIFEPQYKQVTTIGHQYADPGPYDKSIVYDRTDWYGYTDSDGPGK